MEMKVVTTCIKGVSALALLALGLAASSGFAEGPFSKLAPELKHANPNQQLDVIVHYRVAPTRDHYARVFGHGGQIRQDLHQLHAGAFHIAGSSVAALADDPDVDFVAPDRTVEAKAYSQNPDLYEDAVNAPQAWLRGFDGSGIGVAVIDSGITNNGEFDRRIVYSQNFANGPAWMTYDRYGHGTHVAGIIAGNGSRSSAWWNSKTFIGVANNTNLINLRVLDNNGKGTDSQVIAAIQTAIALKDVYNIRVINLSIGRGVYESYTQDPLCQAVEAAWKAGIVVVVAAGNDGRNNAAGTYGYGTINAPGNDPYALTVGAMKPMGTPTRTDDLIASYSSKGPSLFDQIAKPDIVAPGNLVISTLSSTRAPLYTRLNSVPLYTYDWFGGDDPSRDYFTLNGTSMSTAVVSGAAALLLQKNPTMAPDQLKARLMKTAFKTFPRYSTTKGSDGQTYTDQYDMLTVGAGYLDIAGAMNSTDLAPATTGIAKSPSTTEDASGNISIVTGSAVLWGSSVLWGTSEVWGDSIFINSGAPQSQSVLWGSSFVQGDSVLWGSSNVNASSVLWGSAVLWGSSSPDAKTIQIEGEQ